MKLTVFQVKRWTNLVPHYGNTSTSRIEGNHAVLKSYLCCSTGDMKSVFERFQRYWRDQHQNLLDAESTERMRIGHSIQIPLLGSLIGFIYQYALRKIVAQKARLGPQPPPFPCACGIPTYMGIPCYHKIWERQQGEGLILAEDIHAHWWYDRVNGAQPHVGRQLLPLLNPDIVKGKGRPKGAKGQRSTLPTGVTLVTGLGVEQTAAIAAAMHPKSMPGSQNAMARGGGSRGRGFGRNIRQPGRGKSSTRRNPSAFEYDAIQLPSSSAPPRVSFDAPSDTIVVQVPQSPAKNRVRFEYQNDDEGFLDLDSPAEVIDITRDGDGDTPRPPSPLQGLISPHRLELSARALRAIDRNRRSIAAGKGPTGFTTTELALARGAGSNHDTYIPGTVRERAYMRAATTLKEHEFDALREGDDDEENVAARLNLPTVKQLDLRNMPPPSTAPASLHDDVPERFDFEGEEDELALYYSEERYTIT
jgi:hypothetical protein